MRVDSPQAAAALGIATVYQDLALCDNLDVVANLFLGREEVGGVGLLDETAMEQQATKVLTRLAVRIPSVRTQVASLSGGQRQSVAVARSMLGEAQMVVLDEPTAALGVAQTAQVLDLIRRLREQGLAVVVISHNLADVFAVADRDRGAAARPPGRGAGRQADQLGGGRGRHHRGRTSATGCQRR